MPVRVEEDGVVGAAPPRLGLGGHVDRVARRLHVRARSHGASARIPSRVTTRRPRSRSASSSAGSGGDERDAERAAAPAGPGVQTRRRTASGVAACVERSAARPASSARSSGGRPIAAAEAVEPLEVLRRAGTAARRRRAASRTRRGRAGAPRRRRAARARPARRSRGRRRRPRAAVTRATAPPGSGAPIAASSGARLRQRLLDLGRRLGVPDDPAADPEVDPALARRRTYGSSARARGRRSPRRGRARPSTAPRPTGSSSAIRSSAAIFGAPVTEPPGNVAASSSARPTSSRSVPSTVETRCSTPASRRDAIS